MFSALTKGRVATIVAIAPLVLVSACSTGGQRLTRSGFLADYSQMKSVKGHKKDRIFVAADYAPAAYTKVIIDPVEWYAPRRQGQGEARGRFPSAADALACRALSGGQRRPGRPGGNAGPERHHRHAARALVL